MYWREPQLILIFVIVPQYVHRSQASLSLLTLGPLHRLSLIGSSSHIPWTLVLQESVVTFSRKPFLIATVAPQL